MMLSRPIMEERPGMGTLVIGSDESALALLESLLRDPNAAMPEVEFDNWPRFEMHVKGERYHSTITPELIREGDDE